MNKLILVRPSKVIQNEILDYKQEHLALGVPINGSCGLEFYNDFDEWLKLVTSIEKEQLRNGVHTSTFFSVREQDKQIIGCCKIHHSLTSALENGGHIAYGIRPTERNKEYGKMQLQNLLEVARNLKMHEVMIVCNKDNIASARTAMSCGGILIKEFEEDGILHQRYIINLF